MHVSKPNLRQAAIAVALVLGGLAGSAQAQVSVNINVAPPAPRYEPAPVLRPGYVWAPGYWAWQGRNYVWVRGHQIRQRPGHRWVPDRWEDGNRYRAGYWEPERHARNEHRDDHDRHEDYGNKHGKHDKHGDHFCPPGQAKKGNC